jgi:hypothetical protein
METALGKPLDDLTKSIIRSSVGTTGSALAVTEPTFVEPLDVSKLGLWAEVITGDAVARGKSEQNRINQARETVLEMSKTGTPEKQALAKELMDWLGKRGLAVTEAVENATGKNPDYFEITSLYGNDVIPKAMKAQPKLRTAVLPDYIKEAKDAAPVEVPNLRVFAKLKDFKIIQKGDLVKLRQPDGTFKIFIYAGE